MVIELTGFVNANTQADYLVVIEQMCDLHHMHIIDQLRLSPWGDD